VNKKLLLYVSLIFLLPSTLLLNRLSSWFGFDGTVISWLTSYLSSRNFVVSTKSTSSAQSPLRRGVPQGLVYGPLLFILNTTPLSSLISDSSVGHHLFADDNSTFHLLLGT